MSQSAESPISVNQNARAFIMRNRSTIGRSFYGIGIIAYGLQQLIIGDFRPEILPPFPAWAHQYVLFPIITGLLLILAGLIILGVIRLKGISTKNISLYLGGYFLLLIVLCHLPYNLVFSPNKASHLGVWVQALKELAYTGGAFVVAGSLLNQVNSKTNAVLNNLEKLIPYSRIFFSTTMILFGWAHFVYIDGVATLVPLWLGQSHFWTYVGGTLLILAGLSIVFNIYKTRVALLLAIMLFIWFVILHTPRALENPYSGNGNEIVSAFDAFLFCGIALLISDSKNKN